MKVMMCIPVELTDVNTTKRSELRDSLRRRMINMARDPKAAADFFRTVADRDLFLVRAPEFTPGEVAEREKAALATTPAPIDNTSGMG